MKSSSPGTNAASYIACVTDPWHAAPAQLPDEFQGPTIPLKLKQTTTIAGTVSGANALLIRASMGSFTSPAAVTAAGVVTWGAGVPSDDSTDFTANFDEFRFISIGVKIVYIGQADLASGQVIVYPFLSRINGTTAGVIPANLNDWRDNQSASVHSVSIDQKSPVCALHNYDRPPFRATTASADENFPQLAIGFTGIPVATSAQFAVEITYNLEAVPKQGSIHHGLAQASPDHPNVINLARKLTPTVTGVGEAHAVSQQKAKLVPSKRTADGRIIRRKTAGQKWKPALRYPRSSYAVPRNKFSTSMSRYGGGSKYGGSRRRTGGPRMRRFR